MSKGNIFVDTKQLNKIGIELKGFEKEMPGAVASALNRTVNQLNTKIGKIVTQEYAIKQTDVKSTITLNLAKKGDLSASLVSKGHTLSFAHFPYTPKTPVRKGKRRTVQVTIKRSGGKIPSKVGFVATTGADPSDKDKVQFNVFKRLGKFKIAAKGSHAGELREMIAPIRTLSVPQMIGELEVEKQIQDFADQKLNERIQHEIEWRMDKIKSKTKG